MKDHIYLNAPRPCRVGALRACLVIAFLAGLVPPAHAQPANDNFANRAIISGTNIVVSNSLAYATFEASEPFIQGVSSGQTAWWTWTAPDNGIVTLSVGAAGFRPLLAVYAGSDLASLTQVASNNYVSCYDCPLVNYPACHWLLRGDTTFHVTRAQTFQIAVDSAVVTSGKLDWDTDWGPSFVWSTNFLAGGDYHLALKFTAAPANDEFDNPIVLQGSRLQISASNAGATKAPGEPDHLGNPGGSSVWYSWTAPASGRVTLSTQPMPVYSPPSWSSGGYGVIVWMRDPPSFCTSESPQFPLPAFYPLFAAYTGSAVDSLTPAGCLPLGLADYPYAVCFDAVKNQTYHIAFDGNRGTTGNTFLCLNLAQPAINDGFEHRIPLHGIYVIATGYNAGATHQSNEPAASPGSVGKTVWWSWTAPVSGNVSVSLNNSDYDFPVTIFTGSRLGQLSQVVADRQSVSFEAVAGQTYQIAVSDDAGLTGKFDLVLMAPIIPLKLARTISRFSDLALLTYQSIAGQTVLLQRSKDGYNWNNVRAVVARGNTVNFLALPAPSTKGPYYRAFVIDRDFSKPAAPNWPFGH